VRTGSSGCRSFDSSWCFFSAKCSSSVSAGILIYGAHAVCFCTLVAIFFVLFIIAICHPVPGKRKAAGGAGVLCLPHKFQMPPALPWQGRLSVNAELNPIERRQLCSSSSRTEVSSVPKKISSGKPTRLCSLLSVHTVDLPFSKCRDITLNLFCYNKIKCRVGVSGGHFSLIPLKSLLPPRVSHGQVLQQMRHCHNSCLLDIYSLC
jgi:hypothetical protein